MKTTRINDHALQLTRYGFVNCYLVRETAADNDGFTLIDTGLAGSGQACKAPGVGPSSLVSCLTKAGIPYLRNLVLEKKCRPEIRAIA